MNIQDLKSSETVGAGNAAPFAGGWLHGTVVGVEPARDLIFLRARETKGTLAIRWEPETQFAMEGRPGSSAELRPGQSARIHCRFAHHELEADNISMAPAQNYSSDETNVIPLWTDPRHSNGYGRKEKHPHR